MIAQSLPDKKEALRDIWQETQELTMIFQKITNSLKGDKLKIEEL
jgi:hypothetical protein